MRYAQAVFGTFFFTCLTFARTEESLRYGRFGTVSLYYESPRPSQVVLFVSGDGGWNLGVIDMARALASLDALVIGIDINHYLNALEKSDEKCSYPAADFEALSKFVQKQLDFPNYLTPVLVGYSSGATLVYTILVQSPPNTFKGAISLGFCPDLPLTKPICRGNGLKWKAGPKGKGYSFLPATNLEVPWIAFQGKADQVCNADSTQAYVKQVLQGELVLLPRVGHGFSVQRNWMPQFKEAFARLIDGKENIEASDVEVLKDLPLVEVPAKTAGSNLMAVHLTGDGGWGVTDRGLSENLAAQGIPVVGLNSLRYFWTKHTPETAGNDFERILRYYLTAWRKERVILIGYSFGADVLPFLINRLSHDLRSRVQLVVLLGPSRSAEFEFHLTDWLNRSTDKDALPVMPQVEKLQELRILCFCGDQEQDSLCKDMTTRLAHVITLQGGHRLGGKYAPVAEAILGEVR